MKLIIMEVTLQLMVSQGLNTQVQELVANGVGKELNEGVRYLIMK